MDKMTRTGLSRKLKFLFDMAVPVKSEKNITRASDSGNLKAVGQQVFSNLLELFPVEI